VLLPLAEEQPAAADPGQATVSGGAETVLVVDDEPVVRTMMGRALEQAGYAVLYAESGAAALARAEEHAGVIHVLLSDLVMPGMSGRELARRLAERRPGLGVLFVSGFPGEEVERRGLLEGGRPFLAKPFTPETLIERVRGVADAARVSGTRI